MIPDMSLTSREMRAVELNAAYLGVSRLQLMENAGRAVADVVRERSEPGSRIAIACGLGGNGGDGFVAARHLAGAGYHVEVLLLGSSEGISSVEALINWSVLQQMRSSISLIEIRDSAHIKPLEADAIVDALIGTGVSGVLASPFNEMVQAINASEGLKIAVDVPTGVESDTGDVHGVAVRANITITFHKQKVGFEKAGEYLGDLVVCPIGIPPEAELFAGPGDVYVVSRRRTPNSRKGDFGRLLVVGGSETYSGAPALTAMGAYATGVDLVYVAAPETAASIIAGFGPNMITVKLKGSRLTPRNIRQLQPFLERVDAVAIGPGLGLHDETVEAADTLIGWVDGLRLPTLIDADALKAFARRRRKIEAPAVFTPHSGEFEILTGKKVSRRFEDQGRVVRDEAATLGATILLKGSVDIVSDGTRTRYNWTGNPGMTVGGTGDVLSGVTSALMAMGSQPFEAAVAGAFINGAAGDAAYEEKGYHLAPTDLVERIPKIIENALAERMKVGTI